MSTRRLFVAIPIEHAVMLQTCFEKCRHEFRHHRVHWLHPSMWHVTLWFMGNVDEGVVDNLCDDMQQIAMAFSPFEVNVEGLGWFSSRGHRRIVWAGVAPSDALSCLQKGVASKIGHDAPFVPHITLGRTGRNEASLWPSAWWLANEHRQFDRIQIDGFALYESTLSSEGSAYRRIADYKFGSGIGLKH